MIKGLDKEKYEVFDITPRVGGQHVSFHTHTVKVRDKRSGLTSKCNNYRSSLQNAQQALKHVKAQNYHYGLKAIFQFIENWTLYQNVLRYLEGEQIMEACK